MLQMGNICNAKFETVSDSSLSREGKMGIFLDQVLSDRNVSRQTDFAKRSINFKESNLFALISLFLVLLFVDGMHCDIQFIATVFQVLLIFKGKNREEGS